MEYDINANAYTYLIKFVQKQLLSEGMVVVFFKTEIAEKINKILVSTGLRSEGNFWLSRFLLSHYHKSDQVKIVWMNVLSPEITL